MKKLGVLFLLSMVLVLKVHAVGTDENYAVFEGIFKQWTAAFNAKKLPESCALFAKTLRADYQGAPSKSYDSICHSFAELFKLKDVSYNYQFKLHQVYQSGDLAAARITWYLWEHKDGKRVMVSQDEGLDVFQKNQQGKWEIVNYVAYPMDTNKLNS